MAAASVSEVRRNRLPTGAVAAVLFVLWVSSADVCAKVQKQVVMFHQYPVRVDVDLEARTAIVSPPDNIPGLGKSRTFYDYNTRVIAYKDYRSKQCHLERMSDDERLPGAEEEGVKQKEEVAEGSEEREAEMRLHRQMGLLGPTQNNRNRQKRTPKPKTMTGMRRRPKTMYVTETVLTKYEVLRLAGRRISHFCRGFPATLLVQRPPNPSPKLQSPARIPWLSENELPGEGGTDSEEHKLLLEAALVKARLAELELQTLDSSDEENPQGRGKANKGSRSKRQTTTTRGSGGGGAVAGGGAGGSNWYWPKKYRGQTQSQFVSFGGGEGKTDGTAQAESRPDGTTSIVRGVNGMGQSQSQSSVGDGCEGCYPGGGYSTGTYPAGSQYGPWQAGYGTGSRIAPGAIAGQTGVNGVGAGRGTGVGPTGTRGYGPGVTGYGRPAPGTPGAPGYDGVPGMTQGQYLRPGSLAQRPGVTGAGAPDYGGPAGVAPGRGLGGVRGYGTDGTGPTAGGPGYRRPSTIPGTQPGSAGYLGPTGTGYGAQPGGVIRGPGYRGPGVVNGHVGPTGGGAVSRPVNGGIYPGRPGYAGPSTPSQLGGPGYGQVTNGAGGLSQRPTGPSAHITPGDGRGISQPGSHIGFPSSSGLQVTDGGGQHIAPGMIQRPIGGGDYGAPGYGAPHAEGDGRHAAGGRIPDGGPGAMVPSAHGGQQVSPGVPMVPSGHGVSGHGLYGPVAGHGLQAVNGYGQHPAPGRGVHDGRGHHVPLGPGGQVGTHGVPGGHVRIPGGHVGVPGGHIGVPGRHIGVPGGHVGVPGGHVGVPGGHVGVPGGHVGVPGGHVGVPGGHVGVPGGHVGLPGGHIGLPGGHPGMPGHVPGGHVGVPGRHTELGVDGIGGGYPGGASRPGIHTGPHGVGVGGHPSQIGGYDRYPTGSAGHGLTAPGGDGRHRGPGVITPGGGIPGQLAPESIRTPGGAVGVRYPDGSVLRPGQVSPGVGGTTGIGGVQRPDGTLVGPGQYGGPGAPGYPAVQRPGYGIDGQTQYGRPGYYDGQAYPLTRPGAGGRGQLGGTEAGESQAQSSVTQDEKEIKAGASSQGRLGDGKAQAQVSGSYSGTGSFSAQAQTNDGGRSAQSQVTGNKEGGSSSAQGNGGSGQSQAQVQLSSASGATKAEAQSGGWQHGSNTQVQAGENGGMADAQSSGPGTTSSQAQVGFKPYRANGNVQRTPFRGGGTASAQSSSYSGQSQSQVQGAYRYGVSFTGAAQAGSGARGSRGASNGSSRNGTQRFERDDHAALNPESFKLKPLTNFGDISMPSLTGTQDGNKSPESLVGQRNGNGGTKQQGGMDHSSTHTSQQQPSNIHQMGQHGANGHMQFNGNSHGMQGSHLQGSTSSQRGHGQNGHTKFNGNNHGMQAPHLDSHSNNQQLGHTSHGTRTEQNGQHLPPVLETSTEMTVQRSPKIDQNMNEKRQPANEHPQFENNMMVSRGRPQHGSIQGGDFTRGTSHSGGIPGVYKTESPRQSQAVFLTPMANEDVHITQASDGGGIPAQAVYQPGQIVPGSSGFVIPEGFRGRVIGDSRSIAGDETLAVASPNNGNSQSQTVVLTPGTGKVNYTRIVRPPHGQPVVPAYDDYEQNQGMDEESHVQTRRSGSHNYMGSDVYTRGDQHVYSRNKMHTRSGGENVPPSLQKVENDYDDEDDDDDIDEDEDEGTEDEEVIQSSSPSPLPNSYVSVTKSVSGQLNPQDAGVRQYSNGNYNLNRGADGGKFAHTYYTKSSTCGYFTFSCNVVFGSNGRAKICKPRPPTNPDGSPCCC